MKAIVEPLDGNKVRLSVEIPESEFEPAIDAAFKKIAKEVRIPGFRPGKAPRRVLEAQVGKGAGRIQALNDSLGDFYAEAVKEHEVDVIAPPEIDLIDGAESGDIKFDAVVEVRPTITVSGYDALKVEIPPVDVTAELVDEQIERFREQYAELGETERAAGEGDFVTIDIEGSQNGEVLPGLVAQAYLYEVGSGGIVPEMDENLTGAKAGDTLSFDAAHPNAEMAEEDDDADVSPLHFEITVVNVKEKVLPDLDDDFADKASEFSTMAEWRTDIEKRMQQVRKAQSQMMVREKIGEALAELVTDELPEPLVGAEMNERLQDMAMRLQAQGLTLEQWLQFSGTDPQQFLDDLRTTAERSARVDLALRAIALAEGIAALEADLDEEFEMVASRVGQPSETVKVQLTEAGHIPALKADIAKRKSLDWLTEKVTITDEDGNEIAYADLAFEELDDEADSTEGASAESEQESGQ